MMNSTRTKQTQNSYTNNNSQKSQIYYTDIIILKHIMVTDIITLKYQVYWL